MPESFIQLTKQELKIYILLGTFSCVMFLLGVTNLLGITTVKTSFTSGPAIFSYLDVGYLDTLVYISPSINTSNMLTCSGCFSSFLQSGSLSAKDIDVESACAGCTFAKASCFESACTWGASVGDICTKSTCMGAGTCFGNTCTGAADVESACIRRTYTRSICFDDACIGDTGTAGVKDASNIDILKDLGIQL